MNYNQKLPEVFPYHVNLPTPVQVALAVGWVMAAGTAFAVTTDKTSYRVWLSEASYQILAERINNGSLG